MASRKTRGRRLPVTKTMRAVKKRVSFYLKKAMKMGQRATAGMKRIAQRISCRRSRR